MRGSKDEIFHPYPASSVRKVVFKRAKTYLAKIAVVLRDAPNQMLTFTQLMARLVGLVTMSEDRKGVKNNIRVCLSSHSCFIKIPVIPDSLNSKRNYWKLDSSQITAKMARRHFKGLLRLFPELAFKLEVDNVDRPSEQSSAPHSLDRVQAREVKFTGPFSIESLLKRDSPPAQTSRVSPLSAEEQRPLATNTKRGFSCYPVEPVILKTANVFSCISSALGSTHHRLIANRAVDPIRRIPVHTNYSSVPYFTSSQYSFIPYVPTFTKVTSHVWQ